MIVRNLVWIWILFCAPLLSAEELRVVSYNVWSGPGYGAGKVNLDRTVEVLRATSPDIAGLQELDQKTKRSQNHDVLAELAEKTERVGTYAPAISYQGGQYGIGTLSKTKPIRAYSVFLPGAEERRKLQVLEFEKFVFFNTHFSLNDSERIESVQQIETERKKFTKPILLTGDFNAKPESKPIQSLRKTWQQLSPNAPTYPAHAPSKQIDYIFITNVEKVTVHEAKVLDAPDQSDHRPVFVHVEF